MQSETLIQADEGAPKQKGPPNRINDLPYREWMKFQKSFFHWQGFPKLSEEMMLFFTKERYSGGRISNSIIIGPASRAVSFGMRRCLIRSAMDIKTTTHFLEGIPSHDLDFALIDLTGILRFVHWDAKLISQLRKLTAALRRVLRPNCYCALIVRGGVPKIPFAWALSLLARERLKLRDEKIGLCDQNEEPYYCVILEAADDRQPAAFLDWNRIATANQPNTAPNWIIPKPPPRKTDEILHPAKFPETLVADLIRCFSRPGDNVLDPMAGTGSALLAAVQMRRNAFGIELSEEFAQIARNRVEKVVQPDLFVAEKDAPQWRLVTGDATQQDTYKELGDSKFKYVITSPPYWSMLRNKGSENQRARREKGLRLEYSDSAKDLGNIEDYESFLKALCNCYRVVAGRMLRRGRLVSPAIGLR
jgi:DNA methylase